MEYKCQAAMRCKAFDRDTKSDSFDISLMALRQSCVLFTIGFWLTFLALNDITDYQKMKPALFLHRNCRNGIYPQSKIERTQVPDQLVPWEKEFKDYQPKHYESPTIEGKPWADPKKGIHHINVDLLS